MKLVNFYRKPISMLVMVTFTILLCFWANQAPAAEKKSGATIEQGDSGGPDFLEEESAGAAKVKSKKKFPWLLVGAVVVLGAAALYFLVLKQTNYELTVSLGAGTSGTPATGKYKKGEVVPYSFSVQTGYANLQVMLDRVAVAASGSVTMDKAHTLTASATQGAGLQVNSTPAGAKIYLNKVDSGQVTPYNFIYTTAATVDVLLRQCGYQDYGKTQSVVPGQTYTIDATLAAGIHEDFNVPASSCWLPNSPSSWSTNLEDEYYKYKGSDEYRFINFYNFPFRGDYTVTVKMNLALGHGKNAGIFLGTSVSATNANGYLFSYGNGYEFQYYLINRLTNFNFLNPNGTSDLIKTGASSAIMIGLNQWNTLKIVKVGINYKFYINNVVICSFNNAFYTPIYCALTASIGNYSSEMLYDYVYLTQ